MLKKTLNTSFLWYQQNFAYILPLILVVCISLTIRKIPYLNLLADSLATLLLFLGVLFFWKAALRTQQSYLSTLIVLSVSSCVFDILHWHSFAEILCNVFCLMTLVYLLYLILWQKNSYSFFAST